MMASTIHHHQAHMNSYQYGGNGEKKGLTIEMYHIKVIKKKRLTI